MAVAFGKITLLTQVRTNGHYTSKDWDMYLEEEKKQAVFLSVIGAITYKLLLSLLAPVKPGEKSYTFLVDKLSEHFNPAPSEIVEFYTIGVCLCINLV